MRRRHAPGSASLAHARGVAVVGFPPPRWPGSATANTGRRGGPARRALGAALTQAVAGIYSGLQCILKPGEAFESCTINSPINRGEAAASSQGSPRHWYESSSRPAVGAVPSGIARQLGHCLIRLAVGRWPRFGFRVDRRRAGLANFDRHWGRTDHDIAMELLICLGQALWQRLTSEQSRAYWLLLDSEFLAGVKGEAGTTWQPFQCSQWQATGALRQSLLRRDGG